MHRKPMKITPKSFSSNHPCDRNFFIAFAAIAWVSVVMGFGPGVKGQLTGQSPFPHLIVHIHVIVFTAWLALFVTQIVLIRGGKSDAHRKLGLSSVILIPVMVALGLATTIISRRANFVSGNTEMLAFMIVPITDMLLFPSFAVPAIVMRKDPATHKRLILLATASLLPASFGRWIGPWILDNFGDGYFGFWTQVYFGSNLMIFAGVLYDRVTRGVIHPVYSMALPWLIAVQAITSAIYQWPGWRPLAQWLIGF